MKHRFFLTQAQWGPQVKIEDKDLTHQLFHVLRLGVGDLLILLDGQGFEYEAEILQTKPALVKILEKRENCNEPLQNITLFQSLIKKDKFEWVLQKGTEVGISRFVPVLSARSEKKQLGRPDRLQSILREASEQSGRGKIPAISDILNFSDVTKAAKDHLNILLDPESDVPLARYFASVPAYQNINLFIGPEGGFTPEERQAAQASGWELVSLGPRILRTETAGVLAAGALLIATQS